MSVAAKSKRRTKKSKTKVIFRLDVTTPVNDGIMEASSFENWLRSKIKVNGKAGALGDQVHISRDKSIIEIKATPPFSKKTLRYLTKKYLKKQKLRDFLRVLSTQKDTYALAYFKLLDDADEEEESE